MLVLATPGQTQGPAAEIANLVSVDNPQIEVRLATVEALPEAIPSGRPAIVVPLLLWSDPDVMARIQQTVPEGTTVTESLGPHPLLAEALHIRLAEKELARVDRMRLLSVSNPVDAVILGTVGGERAVHEAQATAVLLASRLTLPVVAASLDSEPGVGVAAERLRAAGAQRLAISPCLIGDESAPGTLEAAARGIGAGYAEPLGAHGAVAELVARAYGSQLAT